MTPTYNRSTKQYDLNLPDRTVSFPTRPQAEKFIIAYSSRTLYDDTITMIRRWPRLSTRAWKAAILLVGGHVVREPATGSYHVISQRDTTTTYHIDRHLTNCTCPDDYAPKGPGNRQYCKHILAALMHTRHPTLADYEDTIADFLIGTGRQ